MIGIQMPLFEVPSTGDWIPPSIPDLPSWANAKRIGLDIETRDPSLHELGPGVRRGAKVVGVSFSIEDGPTHYVSLAHGGGDNVENPEAAWAYFREQSALFRGTVVGANLTYDLDFLAEAGVLFPNVLRFRDVMVADAVLNELHDSYKLDSIAKRWGFAGKNEVSLREAARSWKVDPKGELWKLPARYVALYAMVDASLPLALLRKQERQIDDDELWPIYELESKVLPITLSMRRRGIRIDWDQVDKVERFAKRREQEALDDLFRLTGVRIRSEDVWKAQLVAKAMRSAGVELEATETGKPKLDKNTLSETKSPAVEALRTARQANKIHTTFVRSMRDHAIGERIHPTFNHLRVNARDGEESGARFGRMSGQDPNLQQQPGSRDKVFGAIWRACFVADERAFLTAPDFSQQEPRMAVHFAERAGCSLADVTGNRYRSESDVDFHDTMTEIVFKLKKDVDPKEFAFRRRQAKDIFLGLLYSMGGAKLCDGLGLPTEEVVHQRTGKMIRVAGPEGQALLAQFNEMVPWAKELSCLCEDVAATRGYVMTLLGRRCRFPKSGTTRTYRRPNGKWAETEYDWTHKALNRLIQGSSGDQTKAAMIAVEEAGFSIQIQAHDEIVLSVKSREEAERVKEIMETCVTLTVPSKVDLKFGSNWSGKTINELWKSSGFEE